MKQFSIVSCLDRFSCTNTQLAWSHKLSPLNGFTRIYL